ncbi:MAG: hypothetical protein IJS67_00895, partial [Clostridia bacterium]|nr:hypothetical protein [Clostridia bacterium]
MRKKLIVLIAAIAVFASVFTFTAMPVAFADPEEESVTAKYDYAAAFEKTEDRAGYANPFDYIKATDKEIGDKISLGNTAKEVEKIEVYSLESEDAAKGGVVDENDYKFDATNATITYYVTDAIHEGAVWYFVEVKMTGDDTVYELRVKVSLDAGKELKYIDFSTEEGAEALQSVKNKITDTEDDTFTVPEEDIWGLVENPVFSRADVKTSVYVSKPGSNWSSNSSSSSITLSKA